MQQESKDTSSAIMHTITESKVNNQTILQEHVDENYEPTPEEIHEYAIYIGIDPDKVTFEREIDDSFWCEI